jgi:hypothetical protein
VSNACQKAEDCECESVREIENVAHTPPPCEHTSPIENVNMP